MSKKMSEVLPPDEILAQLAEECSEFSQASLKLRRAMNGVNPTPKTVPECWENFIEEYADVFLCIHTLLEAMDISMEEFTEKAADIEEKKQARWEARLQAKEKDDGEA